MGGGGRRARRSAARTADQRGRSLSGARREDGWTGWRRRTAGERDVQCGEYGEKVGAASYPRPPAGGHPPLVMGSSDDRTLGGDLVRSRRGIIFVVSS